MATCKDCIHVDVCCSYLSTAYNKLKLATPDFKLLKNIECDECQHFKERSRFVKLPCKVGDTVYSVHGHPDYGYKIEALQAQDVALICSSGELSYSKRLNYFGKTVFLTREEAEQALKEREENAH